ncbi:hypothetical protein Tco_1370425 [Tanacetum coccineum]
MTSSIKRKVKFEWGVKKKQQFPVIEVDVVKEREQTLRCSSFSNGPISWDLHKQILNLRLKHGKPENIKNEDCWEELVTLLCQFTDCDHARVPQIEVFYPSRFRKNVSRREEAILVAQYKRLEYRSYVSKCLSCANSKAEYHRQSVLVGTTRDTSMEVGTYHDGILSQMPCLSNHKG